MCLSLTMVVVTEIWLLRSVTLDDHDFEMSHKIFWALSWITKVHLKYILNSNRNSTAVSGGLLITSKILPFCPHLTFMILTQVNENLWKCRSTQCPCVCQRAFLHFYVFEISGEGHFRTPPLQCALTPNAPPVLGLSAPFYFSRLPENRSQLHNEN